MEGRSDSLRTDEKKERRIDGNYFGEMCAQNLPEASSTLHVVSWEGHEGRGANTAI